MNFSQNELLQMIQMDKDVISSIDSFLATTTKINGFNEGQLKESKEEKKRLCKRIIEKAQQIGGSYLVEQKIYTDNVLKNI